MDLCMCVQGEGARGGGGGDGRRGGGGTTFPWVGQSAEYLRINQLMRINTPQCVVRHSRYSARKLLVMATLPRTPICIFKIQFWVKQAGAEL